MFDLSDRKERAILGWNDVIPLGFFRTRTIFVYCKSGKHASAHC
jgi:hypothetical protein